VTLWGPLHGGANKAVLKTLAEICSVGAPPEIPRRSKGHVGFQIINILRSDFDLLVEIWQEGQEFDTEQTPQTPPFDTSIQTAPNMSFFLLIACHFL
jgi:hypothetical protein